MPSLLHVPLLDLTAQYAPLRDEIQAAIARVCDSQHFVLGEEVRSLEHEIAAYSGTEYGVGVSSGTDALLVALMALDIGPGDEVITSPFTFFATGGVIARLGARPVFCDIEPRTFNLSAAAVEAFLTQECEEKHGGLANKRTGGAIRALLPVHLYGQMADMTALGELASRYGLAVVEDAAQAIGAEDSANRRAGSVGAVGCLSFFPTKNLGAFGDAGMCVTSDSALAERMTMLRVHGAEPKYFHSEIGGNFRLDALQAAVLRIKLRALDGWTAARQANAERYNALFAEAGLGEHIETPFQEHGGRHIYNQYVLRVPKRRDELRAFLAEQQVGTEVYYPLSLHQQACFSYLGYRDSALPESSRAAAEVLALPIFPELSVAQVEYVAAQISEFFR